MNEMETWRGDNLDTNASDFLQDQRQSILPEVEELISERIWPKLPEELRRMDSASRFMVESVFRTDLTYIVVESNLAASGMPFQFFQRLLPAYEDGHLPCGWEGEYPQGRLVVF